MFLKKSLDQSALVRKESDVKKEYFIYIKLFVITGLTWVFGFVGAWVNHDVVWILFIILNGSQGMLIFFAYVIDVSNLYQKCHDQTRKTTSQPQSSSKTSSTTGTTPSVIVTTPSGNPITDFPVIEENAT